MTEQSEFAQKLKAHIDTLDGEIRRLDAKLKVAEVEARQRIERTIGELWAQRGEAETRLDEMRRNSGTAWSELRTGFERAFDEIYAGFRRARERSREEEEEKERQGPAAGAAPAPGAAAAASPPPAGDAAAQGGGSEPGPATGPGGTIVPDGPGRH